MSDAAYPLIRAQGLQDFIDYCCGEPDCPNDCERKPLVPPDTCPICGAPLTRDCLVPSQALYGVDYCSADECGWEDIEALE